MYNTFKSMIFFLTGASGVGKTSLVAYLKENDSQQRFTYLHFDSIGIPNSEEMGDPHAWQKRVTHEWIEKLIEQSQEKPILFEGSTNMEFIDSGFVNQNFSHYQVILIDCSDEQMFDRLIHKRKQPELANEQMKNWRKYLRNQAIERNVPIIDTSNQPLEASAKQLQEIFRTHIQP